MAAAGGTLALVETVKRVIPAMSNNRNIVDNIKEEEREMVDNERMKRDSVLTPNPSGISEASGSINKDSEKVENPIVVCEEESESDGDIDSPDQSFINSPFF